MLVFYTRQSAGLGSALLIELNQSKPRIGPVSQ